MEFSTYAVILTNLWFKNPIYWKVEKKKVQLSDARVGTKMLNRWEWLIDPSGRDLALWHLSWSWRK